MDKKIKGMTICFFIELNLIAGFISIPIFFFEISSNGRTALTVLMLVAAYGILIVGPILLIVLGLLGWIIHKIIDVLSRDELVKNYSKSKKNRVKINWIINLNVIIWCVLWFLGLIFGNYINRNNPPIYGTAFYAQKCK